MMSWIPNALTVSRCILAILLLLAGLQAARLEPVLAAPLLPEEDRLHYAAVQQLWLRFALLSFIAGMLTDFADGKAARWLRAESRFGIWLDPIADKMLVGAGLLVICLNVNSWLVFIPAAMIIMRDIFLTWLRMQPGAGGIVLPSGLAKVKTALEMIAVVVFLLPLALLHAPLAQAGSLLPSAGSVLVPVLLLLLLWTAAALSLLTAYHYVRALRASPS